MIQITPQSVSNLFSSGSSKWLEPQEALFHQGDKVTLIALVEEGQVSLRRVSLDGNPVILQRATAGHVLAEASLYSEAYHCDAIADCKCRLTTVSKSSLRATLASSPELSEQWSACLAHSVQSARFRAELRSLRTVAERLEAWIGNGKSIPGKGQTQQLAEELGVTREALYRELANRR